jgi:GrpB-like predicted nucleotidyltransferase (UPF0157 family)
MAEKPIGPYAKLPAVCEPWDPRAPEVAERLARLIHAEAPDALVEHIGSSSVPGCAGKGVIDLQIVYAPSRLAAVKDALARLGFAPQVSRDPFPEERPMRVGSIAHDSTRYRIHAHVIAADSPEVAETRGFRDRLRADAALRDAYVARKRAIIAAGVTDSLDYAYAKGDFVQAALMGKL